MEQFEQVLDTPAAEDARLHYAGFWIRFGAAVIDGFVLAAINGLVTVASSAGVWTNLLINTVIGVVYYVALESSANQATPGKMAVGIRVGKSDGSRLSPLNALGRYFAKILSGLILGIGYIMAAFDQKNQTLHDKLADTYVYYS